QVDAHREGHTKPTFPLSDLPARFFQYPSADRHDQTCFLGDVDEFRRGYKAMNRVTPADQCLEFVYFACVDLYDRLVQDLKLVAVHGMSQVGLDLEQVHVANVHLLVKDLVPGLSGFLGTVHGGISIAKKVLSTS